MTMIKIASVSQSAVYIPKAYYHYIKTNSSAMSGKFTEKALVDLNGAPFQYFAAHRQEWASSQSNYIYPGPIQYFGPASVCDQPTHTLKLEQSK